MKTLPLPLRVKGVCTPKRIPLPVERARDRAELLQALADPTRLQIMGILRRAAEPVCICDLTVTFDLSQPTISHHMARLREAGLVDVVRRGIWAYYRIPRDLDHRARSLLQLLT